MNEIKVMEEELHALLYTYGVDSNAQNVLAPWIARESLKMNHLYQDLGLKNRIEMGKFMTKNFPLLAAKKPKDKLWKKFIYDEIGKVAPACSTCNDQISCFACMVSELSA